MHTQDSIDLASRKRSIACRDRAENLSVQLDLVESDTVVDVRLTVFVRHDVHLASSLGPTEPSAGQATHPGKRSA